MLSIVILLSLSYYLPILLSALVRRKWSRTSKMLIRLYWQCKNKMQQGVGGVLQEPANHSAVVAMFARSSTEPARGDHYKYFPLQINMKNFILESQKFSSEIKLNREPCSLRRFGDRILLWVVDLLSGSFRRLSLSASVQQVLKRLVYMAHWQISTFDTGSACATWQWERWRQWWSAPAYS